MEDRDSQERRIARDLSRVFDTHFEEIMDLLGDPPDIANIPMDYWDRYEVDIRNVMSPEMNEIFFDTFMHSLDSFGLAVDTGSGSIAALEFVEKYEFDMIKKIVSTTRRNVDKEAKEFVREHVTEYLQDGTVNIHDLAQRLHRYYSPVRAEMIAITEVTRATVEGRRAVGKEIQGETGTKFDEVWITANDEIVRECPICWPRHNKIIKDGFYPPGHVRCRCSVIFRLPKEWYEAHEMEYPYAE